MDTEKPVFGYHESFGIPLIQIYVIYVKVDVNSGIHLSLNTSCHPEALLASTACNKTKAATMIVVYKCFKIFTRA